MYMVNIHSVYIHIIFENFRTIPWVLYRLFNLKGSNSKVTKIIILGNFNYCHAEL